MSIEMNVMLQEPLLNRGFFPINRIVFIILLAVQFFLIYSVQ